AVGLDDVGERLHDLIIRTRSQRSQVRIRIAVYGVGMTGGDRRFERAALVVNGGSRTGTEAFEAASHRLGDLGVPLADCFTVTDGARLPEAVDDVLDDGCDLVVVGG